jgi:hypothetical protein
MEQDSTDIYTQVMLLLCTEHYMTVHLNHTCQLKKSKKNTRQNGQLVHGPQQNNEKSCQTHAHIIMYIHTKTNQLHVIHTTKTHTHNTLHMLHNIP